MDTLTGRSLLTADGIVIAVGTRPSKPRGVEPDGQTVITSDDIVTLKQLPRSLAGAPA